MPNMALPNLGQTPKPLQFSGGAPGSGAQVAGYNSAMQNLNSALKLSGQTTNAQQMQLTDQLNQNQGNVAQNLAQRGLGNTTVSQTMAQAPIKTFNQGMAQVGDLNAQRQMGAYGNLAQAAMQGGQAISQMGQPYAQSGFAQGLQQQQMAQANMQGAVAHQNQMGTDFGQQANQMQQYQNLLASQQPQQPLYYQGSGAGVNGDQMGGGANAQQQSMAELYPWLAGDSNFAQSAE